MSTTTRCHPGESQVIHTIRHRWMKSEPAHAERIGALSGDEIWMRYLRCMFCKGLKSYGPQSATTQKMFKEWQDFAQATGYQRIEFDDACASCASDLPDARR